MKNFLGVACFGIILGTAGVAHADDSKAEFSTFLTDIAAHNINLINADDLFSTPIQHTIKAGFKGENPYNEAILHVLSVAQGHPGSKLIVRVENIGALKRFERKLDAALEVTDLSQNIDVLYLQRPADGIQLEAHLPNPTTQYED